VWGHGIRRGFPRGRGGTEYRIGEPVIYRVTKRSAHPGRRATDVQPEPLGEDYQYQVDKFWVVAEVRPDGNLLLMTRRGKEHLIRADSPLLRRPRFWERWLYANRFPQLDPVREP
jgi:hypothetical protein